jgi:hypothetical protein
MVKNLSPAAFEPVQQVSLNVALPVWHLNVSEEGRTPSWSTSVMGSANAQFLFDEETCVLKIALGEDDAERSRVVSVTLQEKAVRALFEVLSKRFCA